MLETVHSALQKCNFFFFFFFFTLANTAAAKCNLDVSTPCSDDQGICRRANRHATYKSVSHLYVRYVTQKYGAAAIVFDRYNDDPTTKDVTHLRRTGDCVGVTVLFASGMMIKSKKDEFLNNKANKQRFIHYLSDNLERAGCSVDHAKDDADVLIVLTAVASARHKETILIGDDTDLLVLLLHHAEMDAHEVFLKSEPKKSA